MASLRHIIRSVGKRLRVRQPEIEQVLTRLAKHWIHSFQQYVEMGEELRLRLDLPVGLYAELDKLVRNAPEAYHSCYVSYRPGKISLLLDARRQELSSSLSIEEFGHVVLGRDMVPFASSTPLRVALCEGNHVRVGKVCYSVVAGVPDRAVAGWLASVGMERYVGCFATENVHDFYAMPFLDAALLSELGVEASDVPAFLGHVESLRALTPLQFLRQWVTHAGFEEHASALTLNSVTGDMSALEAFPLELRQLLQSRARFNSVEHSFRWLREHDFSQDAFLFAQQGIAFYLLPFFLVKAADVASQEALLQDALENLRHSAEYRALSVAYWLADLQLSHLTVCFAASELTSLEKVVQLSNKKLAQLAGPSESERTLLQAGIAELQDFYYVTQATGAILEDLGGQRYSTLTMLHSLSAEALSQMDDPKLRSLGLKEALDREDVLRALASVKSELPKAFWSRVKKQKSKSPSRKNSRRTTSPAPSPKAEKVAEKTTAVAGELSAAQREKIDREVEEFQRRLEEGNGDKAKLSPIFFF